MQHSFSVSMAMKSSETTTFSSCLQVTASLMGLPLAVCGMDESDVPESDG